MASGGRAVRAARRRAARHGRGYPAGLPADQTPVEAKILAVADAYEAMTADRPYRRAMPAHIAQEELRRNAGGQFDPAVVDAFLAAVVDAFLAVVDAGAPALAGAALG